MFFISKVKINLAILVFTFLLCNSALAQNFKEFSGQINASDINLRVDATSGATAICKLVKGEFITVVNEAYDWYKIRLPKIAPVYIKKDLVECIKVANLDSVDNKNSFAAKNPSCLSAKVIGTKVNLRLGPSQDTWILGKLNKLAVVNIRQEENGWYRIDPPHESYGWVNKKFVDKGPLVLKPEGGQKFPEIDSTLNAAPIINELLKDQLVVEGQVSPYGVVLWRKATHKLITTKGEIYLLSGNRKSLDSLNYHKIKISGKILKIASGKYPIIEIDTLEALK